MPGYEMTLILRSLERAALSTALHRSVAFMLNEGAVVRSLQNLGHRRLPARMGRASGKQMEGHYFLVNFDSPTTAPQRLSSRIRVDTDVVRVNVAQRDDGWQRPCRHPDAVQCEFGEIKNPNYEKTARVRHGFRLF